MIDVKHAWTATTWVGAEHSVALVPEADGENEAVVSGHYKAGVSHTQSLIKVVTETSTIEARTKH